MKLMGSIKDARLKVFSDISTVFATIAEHLADQPTDVETGVYALRLLRREIYEEVNQIQHEYMILQATEWLTSNHRASPDTLWHWNPRQTGTHAEPDLRGKCGETTIVSAEITASEMPNGILDTRMRNTLRKLSTMPGERFYFVRSVAMLQRAQTKVRKQNLAVEVVMLPFTTQSDQA